ncbi:RadC family protein [Aquimarina brevivitae]|uniref:DNA repair protein RadC n=1 Tax=Aquimarina brevivitae TaxID=323412 RepID=A0A4Q7PH91_9FLAO|nr:DNA repair protein RadC [Aquimarina brevivitae]RZS99933.1 DNA repair protein RadC [Aquimarina brevivitae]
MKDSFVSFSIKKWSEDDRPREKLIAKGKSALTDAELAAILIGSGNREESAVDLSKRILASVNHDLNNLGKLSLKELMTFKGIGEAKAIAIMAALELGRRRKDSEQPILPKISCSSDVFQLMRPIIGDLEQEAFWVLYLNNANHVISKKQISLGGKTSTLVDTRIVFKHAIDLGAVAVILAHNHPSGTIKPSTADKRLTEKIKNGGEILEVKLLDHLIITENKYFSFADESLL